MLVAIFLAAFQFQNVAIDVSSVLFFLMDFFYLKKKEFQKGVRINVHAQSTTVKLLERSF